MKFSIIVVSLNPGDRLIKTVNSILKQTYTDFEVIVKDGGTKDGSLENLKTCVSDERVKITISKDSSIYEAMNQAIKLCSGEYYIFLNCGDLFENDFVLEKMSRYIDGGRKDIYYGTMKRAGAKGIISWPKELSDFDCYRNIPCHQVCFYKNELFAERGYDLNYPVRADYEHFLWCKYEKRAKIVCVPVTVCLYEGQGFSETKEHLKLAAKEHKIVTSKYIGAKCILYKAIMIITLQPLRKAMAESKYFSYLYQKIKGLMYGRAN